MNSQKIKKTLPFLFVFTVGCLGVDPALENHQNQNVSTTVQKQPKKAETDAEQGDNHSFSDKKVNLNMFDDVDDRDDGVYGEEIFDDDEDESQNRPFYKKPAFLSFLGGGVASAVAALTYLKYKNRKNDQQSNSQQQNPNPEGPVRVEGSAQAGEEKQKLKLD